MGLTETSGHRKLSWYAFAGGNSLSLSAPSHARRRARFSLSGVLKNSKVGGIAKQKLLVQRKLTGSSWRTVTSVTTSSTGAYSLRVSQTAIASYRVVCDGLITSAKRVVHTP